MPFLDVNKGVQYQKNWGCLGKLMSFEMLVYGTGIDSEFLSNFLIIV